MVNSRTKQLYCLDGLEKSVHRNIHGLDEGTHFFEAKE